jgi:hypothetical protein
LSVGDGERPHRISGCAWREVEKVDGHRKMPLRTTW